ncbi:hypothetical protein RM549_15770 [Salegentibacter sp. F188]|uniref:Uncharacterized protein n=1 Tax=Autumnicola patrickiae TaxID=3075591 RepID=A0ABU3E5K0_9FLAO|nr:hypothetical protein [Salegentibacter sp. F188]MDT0691254.1 hypothetical protein [Salegentibacter sp. F188]
MILHLKEYVDRLKNFSQKLDNFSILTEQPWVTNFGSETDRCIYIFRQKENQLLISTNGKVKKGNWDYLPSLNSLLIEHDDETILFSQGFFDNSIMILRRDGTDDYQLFVNENKIESTIEKLLQKTEQDYLSKNGIKTDGTVRQLSEKIVNFLAKCGEVKIHTRKVQGYEIGDKILINGNIPCDGKIELSDKEYVVVENGLIEYIS